MAENASHGPGSDSDYGGERQRHMMGEGKGTMAGGDFGVGSIPGTRKIDGGMPNGTILSDGERRIEVVNHVGAQPMGSRGKPGGL